MMMLGGAVILRWPYMRRRYCELTALVNSVSGFERSLWIAISGGVS